MAPGQNRFINKSIPNSEQPEEAALVVMGDKLRGGHLDIQLISLVQEHQPGDVAAVAVGLLVVAGVSGLQQDAGRGGVSQAVPQHVGTDQGGGTEGRVRVVEDLAVDEVESGREDVDLVVLQLETLSHVGQGALGARLPMLHGCAAVTWTRQ